MLLKTLRQHFLQSVSRYYNSRGDDLWRMGDLPKAERYFRQAIGKNRRNANAYSNLGAVLLALHRYDEGFDSLEYAARLEPCNAGIQVNLGNAFYLSGRPLQAIAKYREALAVEPGNVEASANVLRLLMETCDWEGLDKHLQPIQERMAAEKESAYPLVTPYNSLFLPFTRKEQLEIAQMASAEWVRELGGAARRPSMKKRDAESRIRIGYLSSDFHDHATAHLTLGIYGYHDRKRFEIYAYSLGYPDSSSYRKKIEGDCDQFVDVHQLGSKEIAKRISRDQIDILVDLKGYTGGGRPSVLALRPAPIQVNYLGYPGTMGADFIDYLIADPVIIPESHAADYSETIIRLPHSYQATDDQQPIDSSALERQQAGLPEDAFVYCCFNTPAKIDRRTFSCWLKILAAVPNSVLWLLAATQEAKANLGRAASQAGIDPARLIYGPSLPKQQHLARLRLADLALDTFICNAHTTATDVLWAGVPIVTLTGDTFAARVATSLVQAVGLPELAANSDDRFVALAVDLANNPSRLRNLRQKLLGKTEMPLFDTRRFVGNLDDAYEEIYFRSIGSAAAR